MGFVPILEKPSAVPECHGSEAEFRNEETCIAEPYVFPDASNNEYLRSCHESKAEMGVGRRKPLRASSRRQRQSPFTADCGSN
jgi:hypothetical protein